MAGATVIAVVSDMHCGSSVALASPEPIELDDGQEIHPSKAQRWLWQCWTDFWGEVARERDRLGADLYTVYNGDMVDGPEHHGTVQVMSRHPGVEKVIAKRCLEVPQALSPSATFVVRGTESHVGKAGAAEESLADYLGAERDLDRGTHSWWHLRMDLHGHRLSFAHHGRTGYRPWTKPNAHNLLAADITLQYVLRGETPPALAVRSHFHKYGESARHAFPVQVIQTPCWQLHTGFTHRVVTESIADVGGVIITVQDGRLNWRPVMFQPDRGAVWTPATA